MSEFEIFFKRLKRFKLIYKQIVFPGTMFSKKILDYQKLMQSCLKTNCGVSEMFVQFKQLSNCNLDSVPPSMTIDSSQNSKTNFASFLLETCGKTG